MFVSEYLAKVKALRESGDFSETLGEIPARDPEALPAFVIIKRAWTDGSFSSVEERKFVGNAEDFRLQEIAETLLEGEIEVIPEPDPVPAEEGGAN